MKFFDKIIILFLEVFLFLMISVIVFNELVQILKTLDIFVQGSIRLIGMISVLLATDNLLSNKFLGLNLFKIN